MVEKSPQFDICVIGHITKDINHIGRIIKKNPGGSAYYTSIPLKQLGLRVAVITKMAAKDHKYLLSGLKQIEISVFCGDSETTTLFENYYYGGKLDHRVQKVPQIAASFSIQDINYVTAPIFHLGPLTFNEIPLQLLEELSKRGVIISLDGQGYLRRIVNGVVSQNNWSDKRIGLAFVDILKVNAIEARILSGEHDLEKASLKLAEFGPTEVIITLGNKGSIIYINGKHYKIPAFPPKKLVDPTGCGDTYIAGYLFHRLRLSDYEVIGRLAAKLATLKLEASNPLNIEYNI